MTIEMDAFAINTQPVFEAELRPYRSLGPIGLRVVLGLAFALSLINVIFFLATGALPVAMFFGLDFALLFGAFYLNNRAARAREQVSVSRTELTIRKISPQGRMSESRYNPFWARLEIDRKDDGIEAMAVVGQGRRTGIGAFLHRDQREDFAAALQRALATVRRRI
ncbi:DUF2244 domain-containing protein [Rhizobium alvei]|uniref:DUF2244 domain-containing protein n=1 Tax=Rhizobium alvei TaxID=1132659 RepID=A0ABT8YGA0_9HYPH|nr:DUF2244 domain-containing protein [Rhizobium alvei]MDO6962378.1 DUF2244 domain-containing protein [Rhizobium alvei]